MRAAKGQRGVSEGVDSGHGVLTRKSGNSSGGSPTSSNKPLSHSQPSRARRHDVWNRVRPIILERWHGGAERIEVNGESIGMGKEWAILGDLLDALPAETVEAAILASPSLPGWRTPTSLRWLSSQEHGGANLERALGLHYKQLGFAMAVRQPRGTSASEPRRVADMLPSTIG